MPYKDPEKEKEMSKIRMRRMRARRKEEQNNNTEYSQAGYTIEGKRLEIRLYSGSSEEKATVDELVRILTSVDNTVLREILLELRQRELREKKENKILGFFRFIPNLLSLHVDLKMLKQCGGTT